MECYDVHEDTWRELNPMKCFRSHHQLVAMDHKLWAIGGKFQFIILILSLYIIKYIIIAVIH